MLLQKQQKVFCLPLMPRLAAAFAINKIQKVFCLPLMPRRAATFAIRYRRFFACRSCRGGQQLLQLIRYRRFFACRSCHGGHLLLPVAAKVNKNAIGCESPLRRTLRKNVPLKYRCGGHRVRPADGSNMEPRPLQKGQP
jgi:hypothetical protein